MNIKYLAYSLVTVFLCGCCRDAANFSIVESSFKTEYIPATRIMWTAGAPEGSDKLLKVFSGQVAVKEVEVCTMHTGDAILFDYGRELHGGLRITTAIRDSKATPRIRIRFGESVSEAMSDVASTTATNEHSLRDFEAALPWLGSFETGNTGFRFVRIDILDDGGTPLPVVAVEAKRIMRDIPYLGSFRCSDGRLNEIWQTAAYTVHLNMQDYVWDGIKRDRLVWIGDMHPEVMTINTVFGSQDVVRKSLDFARDGTGPDEWMNGICSYSMWWCIIQRDLYYYTGNLEYLQQQHEYLARLLRKIAACMDGSSEDFKEGRFIDWPTSDNPESIHQCLQSMLTMTMKAGMEIATALKDKELFNDCDVCAKALASYIPSAPATKQAAALMSLAGILPATNGAGTIAEGGSCR